MTSSAAPNGTSEIHDYPMPRAVGCPFDPASELRSLQHESPLVRARLADGSTPWLVTRYRDQRSLLADPRISADVRRPGFPSVASSVDGMAEEITFGAMDDPEHGRLRRMVTAPLTVKRVEALRPAVQRIVDDLIDEMLAGPKPADLVESFALPVGDLQAARSSLP